MIPLKDDNPTRSFSWVTLALVVLNSVVFAYEISLGSSTERLVLSYGAIPFDMFHSETGNARIYVAGSIFTAMFLHGGFLHLAGNMLYLWIFGNNIEDIMGHRRFIVFYLLCGIVAAYAHAYTNITSHVPMIGASGAVAGVLGAYLILFPRARILTLLPIGIFIQIVKIPALIVLGFWFVIQFFNGLFAPQQAGGVAWFAHIGGFLAGIVLLPFFKKRGG